MTKLKKKILLVLLRYKKNELPNIFKARMSQEIWRDKKDKGLAPYEIGYFISWDKGVDGFKYQRALNGLKTEGLVQSHDEARYHRKQTFYLSQKGETIAENIKKEITEFINDWKKTTYQ